jgi:hypothetical protein
MRTVQSKLKGLVAILSLSALSYACATAPSNFQTPAGPIPGDQTGPFEILGLISRNTSTQHRPDARTDFDETVTVNVPPGTEIIVPAMRGWWLGYGSTTPEDISTTIPFTWRTEDHHFGVAYFDIIVTRIDAVDNSTTPPTQTATIHILGRLTDNNLDDSWWGLVDYTLLCLGRRPPG